MDLRNGSGILKFNPALKLNFGLNCKKFISYNFLKVYLIF